MSVPSLDYFLGGTQENKQLTLFSDSIGKKIKIKNNHSHEKTQYIVRLKNRVTKKYDTNSIYT